MNRRKQGAEKAATKEKAKAIREKEDLLKGKAECGMEKHPSRSAPFRQNLKPEPEPRHTKEEKAKAKDGERDEKSRKVKGKEKGNYMIDKNSR